MFDIVTFGHPSLKMKSKNVENFLFEIMEIANGKIVAIKPQVAFFELIRGLTTIKTQSAYSDVENSWGDKIKEHADVQFSFK